MLKLVLDESDSESVVNLISAARQKGEAPSTCWLGEAEFRRSCLRDGVGVEAVEAVIAGFDVLEVPRSAYDSAARFPMPELRTLDAIHIAVALAARAKAFVSYDRRQSEAAAALGLTVVTP